MFLLRSIPAFVGFGLGGFEHGVVLADVVAVGGCDAVVGFVGQ